MLSDRVTLLPSRPDVVNKHLKMNRLAGRWQHSTAPWSCRECLCQTQAWIQLKLLYAT